MTRLGLRPGLEMSLFDLCTAGRYTVRTETAPCLAVVVLCNGAGEGWVEANGSGALPLRYQPRRIHIFFSQSRSAGGYDVPSGAHFKGIEVRASLGLLDRLGMLTMAANLGAAHPLHVCSNASVWFGALEMSRRLHDEAEHILKVGWSHEHDILAESRGLAILSTVMTALREPLLCRTVQVLRDGRKLQEAKALILQDLSRTWTIADLARTVGLGEKRLKAGFKARFGAPVYSYLQQARLHHARDLLQNQGASVIDAALAVGYSNPSRFAQLFKREFGIKPSMVKGGHLPLSDGADGAYGLRLIGAGD